MAHRILHTPRTPAPATTSHLIMLETPTFFCSLCALRGKGSMVIILKGLRFLKAMAACSMGPPAPAMLATLRRQRPPAVTC